MSDLISIFNGLVTLAVGTTAFIIYGKQKRDAKRNAANIILLEIESAEQQLQIINSDQSTRLISENISLMKNASWDTYRYHFVRNFDRNEWDKISDFYNKCLQYDAAVANQGTYFDRNVDQTQMHLQRVLANYASKYAEDLENATPEKKEALRAVYEAKKKDFINAYGLEDGDGFLPPYFYNPRKPSIEAKAVIENIETNLSLTSVGIKLKGMARKRSFWARLKRQDPVA